MTARTPFGHSMQHGKAVALEKQAQRSASVKERRETAGRHQFDHPAGCGCETCALRDPVQPQTLRTRVPLGSDTGRTDVSAHEFLDYRIGEDWSDD